MQSGLSEKCFSFFWKKRNLEQKFSRQQQGGLWYMDVYVIGAAKLQLDHRQKLSSDSVRAALPMFGLTFCLAVLINCVHNEV